MYESPKNQDAAIVKQADAGKPNDEQSMEAHCASVAPNLAGRAEDGGQGRVLLDSRDH